MFAIPAPSKKKKSPKKAERSDKPARSAKRPAKKKAAARKPKKKQEFVLSTDDFLDEPEDDLLEDDDDFEEDFLDEDEEDDEDDFLPPPRSRSRGGRKGGNSSGGGSWSKVGIGIQILAIGLCVFTGAHGLKVLGNLLIQVTFRSYNAVSVLWKLGAFVSFGAVIAWIVGYSFCVMAPKTNGAKGLAITLVSLGGVNVILRFIARIMPLVSSQSLYGSFSGGLSAFGARTGDRWLSLLVQLSFCAELIILPMFLAAVAKARKARQDADASMVACFVAIGYTVVVFIMAVLPMVLSGSMFVGRGWYWFFRILGWLRNIGLLVYLGLVIKAAFGVRRRVG